MATIYFVVCKQCKVARDLDKFHGNGSGVNTRAEAVSFSQELDTFKSALLVSFMAKHRGHDCVFVNEHAYKYNPYDSETGYKWDVDFWSDEAE